ncbi:DUF3253 domain-containing protein [Kocuria rhizophila]|nr:DUF3253 domain-containing protein [Kocuria rhizophila]
MSTDKARGNGPAEPGEDSANGPAEPARTARTGRRDPARIAGTGPWNRARAAGTGPAGQGENGQEGGAAASSARNAPRTGTTPWSGPEVVGDQHGIPRRSGRQLVAERRACAAPAKSRDEHARDRVQDAKVALGERGSRGGGAHEDGLRAREAATIRALLRHRAGKTICPSDVARTLGGEHWRDPHAGDRDVAGTWPVWEKSQSPKR